MLLVPAAAASPAVCLPVRERCCFGVVLVVLGDAAGVASAPSRRLLRVADLGVSFFAFGVEVGLVGCAFPPVSGVCCCFCVCCACSLGLARMPGEAAAF